VEYSTGVLVEWGSARMPRLFVFLWAHPPYFTIDLDHQQIVERFRSRYIVTATVRFGALEVQRVRHRKPSDCLAQISLSIHVESHSTNPPYSKPYERSQCGLFITRHESNLQRVRTVWWGIP
jgi:hypothetical protein